MNGVPLKGITIVDFSSLLPGPLCTSWLAQLGAEVIKIESPAGDLSRHHPPLKEGVSLAYRQLNHLKKIIQLDLKNQRDREQVYELVAKADAVMESFRPGVTRKLGIDFETLKKINSKLVYLSLTGFGQGGEFSRLAGHDINFIALSGMLAQMNGLPGIQLGDVAGGSLSAAFGMLTGLLQSKLQGKGQYIDVSMFDSLMSLNPLGLAETDANELSANPLAGEFPCYGVYRTLDEKQVVLGAYEPKFWKSFCQTIDRPEWSARQWDSKLTAELRKLFEKKNQSNWLEDFSGKDFCFSPVLSFAQAKNLKHVLEREDFKVTEEKVTYGTPPFKLRER